MVLITKHNYSNIIIHNHMSAVKSKSITEETLGKIHKFLLRVEFIV